MDVFCYYCLLDKPLEDLDIENQVVIIRGFSICFKHMKAFKDDLAFEERQRKAQALGPIQYSRGE